MNFEKWKQRCSSKCRSAEYCEGVYCHIGPMEAGLVTRRTSGLSCRPEAVSSFPTSTGAVFRFDPLNRSPLYHSIIQHRTLKYCAFVWQSGLVVFLDVPASVLAARIDSDGEASERCQPLALTATRHC